MTAPLPRFTRAAADYRDYLPAATEIVEASRGDVCPVYYSRNREDDIRGIAKMLAAAPGTAVAAKALEMKAVRS